MAGGDSIRSGPAARVTSTRRDTAVGSGFLGEQQAGWESGHPTTGGEGWRMTLLLLPS